MACWEMCFSCELHSRRTRLYFEYEPSRVYWIEIVLNIMDIVVRTYAHTQYQHRILY